MLLLYCLIFLHSLIQSYKTRRYRGHVNKQYKIESCLTNSDAYVVSGSEDKTIRFWDLVEVNPTKSHTIRPLACVLFMCCNTLKCERRERDGMSETTYGLVGMVSVGS